MGYIFLTAVDTRVDDESKKKKFSNHVSLCLQSLVPPIVDRAYLI